MIKKIVILGPESTGKSSLCEQLAHHYHSLWVPEYARIYLRKHGMNYTYEDLLTIAKGQVTLEDKCADDLERKLQSASSSLPVSGSGFKDQPMPLFIDTDMQVMKVWCEFVFGRCHDWILHQIAQRNYEMYFLCHIDLPWVKDGLREYPDLASRQQLFNIYKDIMINQSVHWIQISGNYEQRFRKAVAGVDDLLATQ